MLTSSRRILHGLYVRCIVKPLQGRHPTAQAVICYKPAASLCCHCSSCCKLSVGRPCRACGGWVAMINLVFNSGIMKAWVSLWLCQTRESLTDFQVDRAWLWIIWHIRNWFHRVKAKLAATSAKLHWVWRQHAQWCLLQIVWVSQHVVDQLLLIVTCLNFRMCLDPVTLHKLHPVTSFIGGHTYLGTSTTSWGTSTTLFQGTLACRPARQMQCATDAETCHNGLVATKSANIAER